SGGPLKLPGVFLQTAVFLLAGAPLAWYWGHGQTVSDESAYRFQARVFASGHVASEALPVRLADFRSPNAEVPFAGHVIYGGRWFAKYPPGWPAALALAEAVKIGWMASLLLGAGILLLTGAIAAYIFDPWTAGMAVLFSAASPYVLYNSMG